MGDLVKLDAYRCLARATERLQALAGTPLPAPEALGWRPIAWTDGRPVRWLHPPTRALIGYVPGAPELVFLDYRHECRAWAMTIEELAVGIEAGTLPEPERVVGWGRLTE